jgi:hypothetical protein
MLSISAVKPQKPRPPRRRRTPPLPANWMDMLLKARKRAAALEAKALSQTKPGMYRVARCLWLQVRPSGRRNWVYRVTIDGCPHCYGLGGYPAVSIEEAKAAVARRTLEHLAIF